VIRALGNLKKCTALANVSSGTFNPTFSDMARNGATTRAAFNDR
jgi:hypothetical protein